MTKVKNIYTKKFSQIQELQEPETINYCLLTTEEKNFVVYGIEVSSNFEKQGEKKDETKVKVISCSEEFVLDIIKYLYENSIKPDTAKCIIQDIINKYTLSGENELHLN